MRILAIETSCDETAISLLEAGGGLKEPKFKILKQTVSSQVKLHAQFGGVVPSLAKREHTINLPVLLKKVLGVKTIEKEFKKIDLIAVTVGPGLEPALWTGIVFAQELSKKYKKPLLGVNHMEGHLFSYLLEKKYPTNLFPAIALVVSGGHTILLQVSSLSKWKKLGETRDDAAGEAYDKVARMLDLPYPGGPNMEKLATLGNPESIKFPRPMVNDKNSDFSFSGLKTSVLYYLRDNKNAKKEDVAASFQQAVIDVLAIKAVRAAKISNAKSLMLSGGVAANKELRRRLKNEAKKLGVPFLAPPMKFNGDNASMIAVAGYLQYLRKKKRPLKANGQLAI